SWSNAQFARSASEQVAGAPPPPPPPPPPPVGGGLLPAKLPPPPPPQAASSAIDATKARERLNFMIGHPPLARHDAIRPVSRAKRGAAQSSADCAIGQSAARRDPPVAGRRHPQANGRQRGGFGGQNARAERDGPRL